MNFVKIKQGINKKIISPIVLYKRRARFCDLHFTIISVNCIGGCIYHDLSGQFDSPTINMFFYPKDFLQFCFHLKEYVALPLRLSHMVNNGVKTYPVGLIGDEANGLNDITIHFLHYDNWIQCQKKWKARCERIHYNKLCFIFSDQNGASPDDLNLFLQINGPKLLFLGNNANDIKTIKKLSDVEEIIRIPQSDIEKTNGINAIDTCLLFRGLSGKRKFEHFFNVDNYIKRLLQYWNNANFMEDV